LNRQNNWSAWIHLGAALVALVGIGCATIAGLDEDFAHEPVCNPIVPPTAPSVKNAGDTIEFSAAVRTVDLDEGDELPRFGYDLDGKCSCTIDGPGCKRPGYVDPKKETCDDIRGIDNGTGVALANINSLAAGALSSFVVNEGAAQGLWTVLVRVRGYSGTANDDHVNVALYETPGLTTPNWNGTDVWPVANTSVGAAGTIDDPLFYDDKAFVRDGVLVAHVPKSKVVLRASTVILPVEIVSVILTAKIVESSSGSWRLTEGTISAKWPHTSLFKGLSLMRYGANLDNKFCRDDIVYLQVKSMFCSATDIIENGGGDPNVECDAISFGMRFDTETVQLGTVTDPVPDPPPECSSGFDPVTDSCVK